MPITTVNSNQLISVAKYNEIQTSSTSVLSYYGVNATSVQIADANAIIYADNHWTKLYDDINKCTIHQTCFLTKLFHPTIDFRGKVGKAFSINLILYH